MKAWVEFCSRVARTSLSWAVSFLVWTVWLGLTLLFFFQLYIVTANELEIPAFVLRRVEERLAEAGLRATFGRTSFDPAGRVLVENVRISLPAFPEPIVTARSAFVRLNPWMLVVGRLEPREVRLTELAAFAPAMLSPSGRPEELIHDLDVILEPKRRAVAIQQLNARVAGVAISAHGLLAFSPGERREPAEDAVGEFLAKRFPALCRQALAVAERMADFEDPTLHLEFVPSESGTAAINILALARSAKIEKPWTVEAKGLRASTRLLLFSEAPASDVQIAATELRLSTTTQIHGLQAHVLGRVRMDGSNFDIREIALTADAIGVDEIDIHGLAARIYPRPLPQIETFAFATVAGSPLNLHAEGDVKDRRGVVQFEGMFVPRVIDIVNKRLAVDVRRFFDYQWLQVDRAEARFGPAGKFEQLTARIHVPRAFASGVTLQDARAEIELRPDRLFAPHAFTRVGDSFAAGSYEHEFKTRRYRFLLEGRLQPLAISEWFREWWKDFFSQLQFPVASPVANVDVRGAWGDGRQSNVFVFADVAKPIIRGTELDHVRTRLFIRPGFLDGLEVFTTRGEGNAHGRFTYITDSDSHDWHTLEVGLDSTMDLKVAAQLLGPSGSKALAPFRLAAPPTIKLRGQFNSPRAPGGANEKLRIEARSTGEFRFHDFPLQDVSFIATIDRDEIVLDDVEASFGGGAAGGHARVWGTGEQRRLGFDFALEDASLGKVAAGVAEFFAAKKGEDPQPPGKFVQEKANVRLNFAASAEGRYDDPYSYRGDGSAVLQGAEIGEVPLFGTLSELLKFTALRFTEARANFKIDGSKIVFPEVTVRGANSAIDAHGTYVLDRRELDFNAKIFPFQESGSLIKSVVGAVLSPLSNAFEVKLTGSLAKPQWAFVLGPTNFLRSLNPTPDTNGKTEANESEKEAKPPRTSASEKLPAAPGGKS